MFKKVVFLMGVIGVTSLLNVASANNAVNMPFHSAIAVANKPVNIVSGSDAVNKPIDITANDPVNKPFNTNPHEVRWVLKSERVSGERKVCFWSVEDYVHGEFRGVQSNQLTITSKNSACTAK